jgi:hypothetical protein
MLIGRLFATLLLAVGFLSALAIFVGSFDADFVLALPALWLSFGAFCLVGTILHSVSSRAIAAERTGRWMGMALLALGLAAAAVLWARGHGDVRVDAPVQLWLLFAVCTLTGGVAVYSSTL